MGDQQTAFRMSCQYAELTEHALHVYKGSTHTHIHIHISQITQYSHCSYSRCRCRCRPPTIFTDNCGRGDRTKPELKQKWRRSHRVCFCAPFGYSMSPQPPTIHCSMIPICQQILINEIVSENWMFGFLFPLFFRIPRRARIDCPLSSFPFHSNSSAVEQMQQLCDRRIQIQGLLFVERNKRHQSIWIHCSIANLCPGHPRCINSIFNAPESGSERERLRNM